MSDRLRFNLHLPGLLKVLAEHLYTSKKVGIRELIQNAHDSCVRRKIEAAEPHYRPRIDLSLDPRRRAVVIRDNGFGLTEDEIGTYLATIGRGYTRELRERLALCSPAEAAELIGQFGLGFLSAFLLASEVSLVTRSVRGGPALRWHSAGDEHYELTTGERDEPGTTVELKIKPAASFILNEQTRQDPVTWKKVVRGHSDVIIGWAVSDNEFFERVEDIVTFRTTRGPLSLPEYLGLSNGSLYYVTRELGSLQEQLLAEGRDVPAIDASWFSVTPFLEKYAQRHPEVGLVQLDGEAAQLLRPVPEGPFADLLHFFRAQGVRARVAAFKPAEAPALMLYPQGADLAREAEASLQAGDLPAPLAGLVSEYVEQKFAHNEDLRGTLYLNASCPLVRRLAEAPAGDGQRDAVLTLLHQVARLFAGRMLSAADAVAAFAEMTRSVEGLLRP